MDEAKNGIRKLKGQSHVTKVAIYAHDSYGLGHLRRSLVIANSLLQLKPSTQILLISGSPVSHLFDIPKGIRLVSLPPVVKVGVDEYRSLEPRINLSLLIRTRSSIIAEVLKRFKPDVLLVDHAPAGLKSELSNALELVPQVRSHTRMILGLRDIVDSPKATIELWRSSGVYEMLQDIYEEIFVYGQQDIFDPISAYELNSNIASKIKFVGYLGRTDEDYGINTKLGNSNPELKPPYILITIGGGGDGTKVLKLALEASKRLDLPVVACTGPLINPTSAHEVAEMIDKNPNMKIVDFIPQMVNAMAESVAVVSMGGYNSLCEAISAQRRPVVVPRIWPRQEQQIRATKFEQRGLLEVVSGETGTVEQMHAALCRSIANPRPDFNQIDLQGLKRIAPAILGSVPALADMEASL